MNQLFFSTLDSNFFQEKSVLDGLDLLRLSKFSKDGYKEREKKPEDSPQSEDEAPEYTPQLEEEVPPYTPQPEDKELKYTP